VLGAATEASAHGAAEAVVAMGMLLVAAGTILLAAFSILYLGFLSLRAVGLVASPARWAAAALVVGLVCIVMDPARVLPFSVRWRLATMDRLFPNMARTGFRPDEVPRLIDMLGAGEDAGRAAAILCGFGDHVSELAAALDSPDPSIRGHAVAALRCIGPPSAAELPKVIRMLEHESNWVTQASALGFLETAAAWEGSDRWVGTARPILVTYLEYPGSIPGNAAVTLEAIGAEAAPAVPALRRVLARRTGTTGDDRFDREHVWAAIRSNRSARDGRSAGCE
jgi:hypothetical protein